MTLFVKLCGLSTPADVEVALEAGADAIGLVMTDSPRRVSVELAAELRQMLPKEVLAVAVFHAPAPELVRRVEAAVSPDLFQATPDSLHGIEGARMLPVVVDGPGVGDRARAALDATGASRFLLDSAPKGGTGRPADWERLTGLTRLNRMVLAGGLNPQNVANALSRLRPAGVDVSSGVEREPGVKDHDLMRAFVEAARSIDVHGEVTV